MRGTSARAVLAGSAAFSAIAMATPGIAQVRNFNVPAQSASTAIPEFARQAGVQIIASGSRVRGITTNTLKGELEVRHALQIMLRGTGLQISSDSGATIVLTRNRDVSVARTTQSAAAVRAAGRPRSRVNRTVAKPADAKGSPGAVGGDIIVTARRTDEKLSDVPISITVFTPKAISNRNIVLASDLATYTPGLFANTRFGAERATLAIRGFNQEIGTAPSVGVYFAEAAGIRVQGGAISGNTLAVGSFMDLQNVQVLKGPQGTLFGRNTTGGAVLIVPAKPNNRFEGYVEGELGNFNGRRIQAVVNLPFAERFKMRIAMDRNTRDGYMINHSGIGPRDFNDTGYTAFRVSAVAKLADRLENYSIVAYSHSTTNGYAGRILGCDRSQPTNPTGRVGIVAWAACDQIDRQAARGDGPLDVDVNTPGSYLDIEQWQAINTTTWHVSDAIAIKNIVSYGEYHESSRISSGSENFFVSSLTPTYRANAAATPVTLIPGMPFQDVMVDTVPGHPALHRNGFTEEFQIQGRTDRLSWVTGYYMELQRDSDWNIRRPIILLNCTDPVTFQCSDPSAGTSGRAGSGFYSESKQMYDYGSYGFFAEGTYKFTPRLSLTLGARYTFDKLQVQGENTAIVGFGTGAITRRCTDNLRHPSPTNPAIGMTVPFDSTAQCHVDLRNDSEQPTWNVTATYKPIDPLMLYVKYGRGYRQGGINLTALGVESWNPEKVDAYELGAKASFYGAVSGYLNFAGFYNNLSDQQVGGRLTPKPTSVLTSGTAVINAGKATIKGIDLDASVKFFRSLQFDIGYLYLDTKVTGIAPQAAPADSPFLTATPSVVEGSVLTFSPKNRVTLTGTYALPLPAQWGRFTLGATYTHTDSQVANATAKFGILPATDLLNINANWSDVMRSGVDMSFYMTNATNQIYAVGTTALSGYDNVLFAPPRQWGFRLRYNFGG